MGRILNWFLAKRHNRLLSSKKEAKTIAKLTAKKVTNEYKLNRLPSGFTTTKTFAKAKSLAPKKFNRIKSIGESKVNVRPSTYEKRSIKDTSFSRNMNKNGGRNLKDAKLNLYSYKQRNSNEKMWAKAKRNFEAAFLNNRRVIYGNFDEMKKVAKRTADKVFGKKFGEKVVGSKELYDNYKLTTQHYTLHGNSVLLPKKQRMSKVEVVKNSINQYNKYLQSHTTKWFDKKFTKAQNTVNKKMARTKGYGQSFTSLEEIAKKYGFQNVLNWLTETPYTGDGAWNGIDQEAIDDFIELYGSYKDRQNKEWQNHAIEVGDVKKLKFK